MTALLGQPLAPADVHAVLGRSMLVDGFDLVLDLAASRGSTLVDARDGRGSTAGRTTGEIGAAIADRIRTSKEQA